MKLTSEIVKELLDYNPETGDLTWKWRDKKWFKTEPAFKTWNTRWAGKQTFCKEHPDGYLMGVIFYKTYKTHRIIWLWMTGEWPDEVDHINGKRGDNRWNNLRNVTPQENKKNMRLHKLNKSGRTGVDKCGKKWRAQICANKIVKLLGYFETFEAACEMRSIAERNYGFHPNHGRIK